MAISTALIKELRERTGLGMLECKKALIAVDGNIEKAIEELRKSGQAKAAKKAGRIAAEGIIAVKVSDDNTWGIMVEINSETDFASRDENFTRFVENTVEQAFDQRGITYDQLVEKMEAERLELVQKVGENISIRRLTMVEGEIVNAYLHGNKRIAVLTALKNGDKSLAYDVALHIAATNPEVISPENMPEAIVEKEKEIFREQANKSGKPAVIVEKMVDGRIRKFLSENSLTEQAFIKDPDVTVGQLVKKADSTITQFVRFEVGEGIEKETVDFAAEVRAQANL
ncbi:MAG: translation elongation factor Ts [Endozoicomonadaceae bacterium]|nr:translation elongation factor Ts [Endozoicomonadaceae bacterium]